MFLTAPNVWLQSWATPGLTRTLEVISWFGYTRTAIAFAALIGFAYHLRIGMALLVLLGLTSLATDVAKTTAALPRPFAVDADVRILGWPAPAPIRWGAPATSWWNLPDATPPTSPAVAGERANAADSETGFGFPSGHVSTTFTFMATLAVLVRRRWIYAVGFSWLALMVLSRLYLGRHFIGDVLGGIVLGGLVVGIGMTALQLFDLARSGDARNARRAGWMNAFVAACLLVVALTFEKPNIGDAGRLMGIAAAVLLLTWRGTVDLPASALARAALVTVAGLAYGGVWAAITFGLLPTLGAAAAGGRLAASALPAFAMLAVPATLANRARTSDSAARSA